ncbi:MAG: YaiI/YqxD family protein [Legionellaceae bacterium]|nr:YaiI/YqxD family protein [Legionellaceae bacterium]
MSALTLWVDADACPKAMRDILFRAVIRRKTRLVLVANSYIAVPHYAFIKAVQVSKSFDSADCYILTQMAAGDLVITSDIPLASAVLEKNGHVISQRGERYTENEIKQRLTLRDINEQLRSYGERSGGPPPLGNREKMLFANALDKWLHQFA